MTEFENTAAGYLKSLYNVFTPAILNKVENLARDLLWAWSEKKQVFVCGNGGSAANAMHMANDFHYGIGACGSENRISGLRIDALPANSGVITCLANDTGYENIYSNQIEVKANEGDLLIVLSGSGNSANIINALKMGKDMNLKSYAILGFSGGECKKLADEVIHFEINDMQIAEDTQLIIGHICMQWLSRNQHRFNKSKS